MDAAAPERSLELADEAFAAGDVEGFITHMSAAIRGFTAADDKCAAAMACVRLGQVFAQMLGNTVAGRAWFARARRLIADEPPCIEQGWVAVAAMGCDVDDPDELLAAADLALDAGAPIRRRRPRDQGPSRWRSCSCAGGSARRGHGDARRGHGLGVWTGEEGGDDAAFSVLVLHRVLLRRRLRAGRVLGRPPPAGGAHRARARRSRRSCRVTATACRPPC